MGSAADEKLEEYDGLSQEDATTESVVEIVDELLETKEGTVLCTHRPVLPSVFEALGVEVVRLAPAGMLVVHHRAGAVVAIEPHQED